MEIKLRATKKHKKIYREILSSNWSQQTIVDCFSLTNDFLNTSEYPVGYSEVSSQLRIEQLISQDLPSYLSPLSSLSANIPKSPTRIPKRRSKDKIEKHNLTNEAIYDLSFPLPLSFGLFNKGDDIKIIGDLGFLRDIQSLTFIMITEYLIPQLNKGKMNEEKNYVIFVLFVHTLVTWYDNPSHQNYLLSILFDELGIKESHRICLYNAFKLTSPDEHDYLTKAQSYWSALMDEELYEEAKHFVTILTRTANKEHLEEIEEITELTFQLGKKLTKR
jgi:hypothetical protein